MCSFALPATVLQNGLKKDAASLLLTPDQWSRHRNTQSTLPPTVLSAVLPWSKHSPWDLAVVGLKIKIKPDGASRPSISSQNAAPLFCLSPSKPSQLIVRFVGRWQVTRSKCCVQLNSVSNWNVVQLALP